MRVALVDSQVAFFHGGAEMLATRLAEALRALHHDVEVVRVPLNPASPRDIERAMDFCLAEAPARWIAPPDVVIALRFPAYLVPHPRKHVWLLHQLRQYYEYYEKTLAAGNAQDVAHARERILEADRAALAGAPYMRPQSGCIARRLERFTGLKAAAPLHPPLPREDGFFRGAQERYVFAASRLEQHKRQWLLIEAMRHVKGDVKAVIAGEGGAYHDYRAMIERHGLQDRVMLCGRLSHELHAAWYANSLAVFFGPEDEDYGFVTLEAMLSGKPVITCSDSGGPLDFVRDGETGFVVEPDPRAIADRIERLAASPRLARDMGEAGLERYRGLGLDWTRTAETLLAGKESA